MYHHFTAVVTISNRNTDIVMGVLPKNCIVLLPFLSVPTAFNSAATDTLKVGYDGDDDAFGTAHDIRTATITLANFTGGVGIGFRGPGKKVLLHYTSTGAAPTLGQAVVILPFILVPSL